MTRHIGLPVSVETDPTTGEPRTFQWRGATFRVQVIGRWHLVDRWWDREYFRLLCPDQQVFELYREQRSAGLWVLDRVLD